MRTEEKTVKQALRKFAFLALDGAAPYTFMRIISYLPPKEAIEMFSIRDTLKQLEVTGENETAAALREVYFKDSGEAQRLNDISLRVRQFALLHYCDDRTVYRRLASAVELIKMYEANYRKKQEAGTKVPASRHFNQRPRFT